MKRIESIIEDYRRAIIQIATPYSRGTGFFHRSSGLIVTNEHVVRDNQEVIIDGILIPRQLADVVFLDPIYDLAFLKPRHIDSNEFEDIQTNDFFVEEGEIVVAVGHPFGFDYAATKGIISNSNHDIEGVRYYLHDAALNPGNSGGPLLNTKGHIIGINTFIARNGVNMSFTLPIRFLNERLAHFKYGSEGKASACTSCRSVIFENKYQDKYCPSCGTQVQLIGHIRPYEPHGVSYTIEKMLEMAGYSVPLSRTGLNSWTVYRGSAKIDITYHEKSGLIMGDAHLCKLPSENIEPLYIYLLEQNYDLKGLTFSVKGSEIILSMLIYDQYLNQNTSLTLFKHLTLTADHFDDILVNEFGASWIK